MLVTVPGHVFFAWVYNFPVIHCVKSVRIRSFSVQMPENEDQNNSKYGHFSRSDFDFPH